MLPFILVGAVIWWPNMHQLWKPSITPKAETDPAAVKLANSLEEMWGVVSPEHKAIDPMRRMNPEWDFMGRTFFVLGEANLALRVPEREDRCITAIDALIADTLAMEKAHGPTHFLMGYHNSRPWIEQPPRSIFVDGEIALCLGARRMVRNDGKWQTEFRERIRVLDERMGLGPVLSAESYPDECWTFCNSVSLAALRMSDQLDGTDHTAFFERWVAMAKEKLLDRDTGMLIAAFTYDGEPHPAGDRPEGTTAWLVAHMLQAIDPEFAREQYDLAREHLASNLLGFGFSKEWPSIDPTKQDIDSGLVIPVLEASASASGLALVGASAFEDDHYYGQLRGALDYFAFPRESETQLSYEMAGAIGNPVLFYSMVEGPLWRKIRNPKSEIR